jgi:uncharacterized protein
MSRPRKCRWIANKPIARFYKPQGIKMCDLKPIFLSHDQLEALRFADIEKLEQIEAASKMNISRSTFSRIVNEARNIVATALVNGWALKIEGGDFKIHNLSENQIKNIKGDKKMARFDKTGLNGIGRLTGKGNGLCGGYNAIGRGREQGREKRFESHDLKKMNKF